MNDTDQPKQNLLQVPKPAKTIDEVLGQLDEIINIAIASSNYIFTFAYVYRETTAKIKDAILNHQFEDGKRMETMDVIFANLFIDAFYSFHNQQDTSRVWKLAFKAGKSNLALVQYILLGMNAHINMDLAIAASEVSKGKNIMDLKHDFMVVNDILSGLTNPLQKGLGKASIVMKLLDVFGFRSDEKFINFSIRKARDFAWLNALELSYLDADQQQQRNDEIDKRLIEIGELVRNPPGRLIAFLLKMIAAFEIRDPHRILKQLKK